MANLSYYCYYRYFSYIFLFYLLLITMVASTEVYRQTRTFIHYLDIWTFERFSCAYVCRRVRPGEKHVYEGRCLKMRDGVDWLRSSSKVKVSEQVAHEKRHVTIFLLQAWDCIAFSALYGYYYLRRLSSPLPSFYYLSNTAGLPQGSNKEHINKKGHVRLLPFTQIRNKVPLSFVTPEKSHQAAVRHSLVRKLIFSRGWDWAVSSIRQSGTLLLFESLYVHNWGLDDK